MATISPLFPFMPVPEIGSGSGERPRAINTTAGKRDAARVSRILAESMAVIKKGDIQ